MQMNGLHWEVNLMRIKIQMENIIKPQKDYNFKIIKKYQSMKQETKCNYLIFIISLFKIKIK